MGSSPILSVTMPHGVTGNTTDSDSVILGSNPNGAVWKGVITVVVLLGKQLVGVIWLEGSNPSLSGN